MLLFLSWLCLLLVCKAADRQKFRRLRGAFCEELLIPLHAVLLLASLAQTFVKPVCFSVRLQEESRSDKHVDSCAVPILWLVGW